MTVVNLIYTKNMNLINTKKICVSDRRGWQNGAAQGG